MKTLFRSSHNISRKNIDQDALKVLYRLNRNGFKAYLVGGAVRDLLLGKIPKDYDIATDARPGQIKKLFSNCFLIGRRFRLAHIKFHGNKIIQVATFRREAKEGSDEDVHNTFGTPEEDAYRRDITINSLFYNIANYSIIDYVGGLDDIKQGLIRIIGDPENRFREDPVRILRVLRHASRLDFRIHNETAHSIFKCRHLLNECSGSRIFEEICRDLLSGSVMKEFYFLDLFSLLKVLFGQIGLFYSDNPESFKKLMMYLKRLDSLINSGTILSIQDIFTIVLKLWSDQLRDNSIDISDMSKFLHDSIGIAGMNMQIPKAITAHIVQVLSILYNMERFIAHDRARFSDRKKMQYIHASKLFGILNNLNNLNDDPFGEILKSKHSEKQMKKKSGKRYYRRPVNKTSMS